MRRDEEDATQGDDDNTMRRCDAAKDQRRDEEGSTHDDVADEHNTDMNDAGTVRATLSDTAQQRGQRRRRRNAERTDAGQQPRPAAGVPRQQRPDDHDMERTSVVDA